MKPTPAGWPRISPGAHYAVAMGMFDWLSRAFGFGLPLKVVKEGRLMHSQLVDGHDYGEGYWCDRAYGAKGPEGHQWWFVQRLRGSVFTHA